MFSLVNKKNKPNVSKMLSDAIKSSEQKGSCSTCPDGTSTNSGTSNNPITCSLGNGTTNTCSVNNLSTTTSVSNCPDGTKYEIKVKNKPGPTGPTGPAGPVGVMSSKLTKFENYLYEVPNSNEVYTIGLESQVNTIHAVSADPVNHYFVNYLNSSVVWLYTNNNTGTYRVTLRNVPDTSSNDNQFTLYMPTTSDNLETNYVNTFIINDISYNIYWEGGLLPYLTDNQEPSIVKQECNILPHFGTNEYRISSRVSYYNTAPDIVKLYARVELNILDEPVYSFTEDPPGVGVSARVWQQQKVIYFQPGYQYIFDFSDPTNLFDPTPLIGGSVSQINARKTETHLIVGTEADNVSTILGFTKYSAQRPGTPGAEVTINIPRIYSGDTIVYFDKNKSNMGYQFTTNTITITDTLNQTVSNGATQIEIASDLSSNFPIGSTIVIGAGLFTEERFVVLGYGSILLGQRNALGIIVPATTKYNHYKNEIIIGEKTIKSIINVTVEQGVFIVDICNNATPSFYNNYFSVEANQVYKFTQEDPSNEGNTILFGITPDVLTNEFKSYMTINGSPGSPGAYTLLSVPTTMNNIVYYSGQNPYFGYGELELDISSTNIFTQKTFIINIINRTGIAVTYSISGDFDLSTLGSNTPLSGILTTPPIVSRLYYYIDSTSISSAKKFIFQIEDFDISLNLNVENPVYLASSADLIYNRDTVTIRITNNEPTPVNYTILYSTVTQDDFVVKPTSTGSISANAFIDLTFEPQLTNKAKGTITAKVDQYTKVVQVYREYIDYLKEISTKPIVESIMTVVNTPNKIYSVNSNHQQELTFLPNTIYYFNQFDGSNVGERIVFGEDYDNSNILYTTDVSNVGIPGQVGSYTILDIPTNFNKSLLYFSENTNNMGYVPLELSVNQNTGNYGDTIAFTILNNTGVNKSYQITGVVTEDIDNAPLTGTLTYGQSHTLSYRLLCADKTLVFNIDGLSETVTIGGLPVVKFAVRTDPVYGNPVFAIEENGVWYDQKPQNFEAGKAYVIDLSNSVTSTYKLTFGPTVGGTPINDIYIIRKPNEIILDLVNYQGPDLVYFDENNIAASYVDPTTSYPNIPSSNRLSVKVAGTPNTVFEINQILQNPLIFNANAKFIFDQSDVSNLGEQLIFGRVFDDASNLYTNNSEIETFGTPGTAGAYTKIELPSTFIGSLYYFSANSKNMGYTEFGVQLSNTSVNYGDTVTFAITNNTGINKTYNITGILSADINNASLTNSLSYGQIHTLTYNITTASKTWDFIIDTITKTVSVASLPSTQFAVQTNANNNPVFATFNETDGEWYNQPNLSFSAPNVYQLDLSSSILGYNLSFGLNGQGISNQYIVDKRPGENVIILDLRFYTGTPVTYFDNTGTVANYVDPGSAYPSAEILTVQVSSNPNKVFDISGISQKQIVFVAGTQYIFDQSHTSNDGEQIVFGKTFDDKTTRLNSQSGVTIVGVPGYSGAYTLLELSAGFTGTLFYFSETSVNMGYQPIDLQVDNSQKNYGDNIKFTITNNTGYIQPYNITISNPNDLIGSPLSGSLNYGEIHDISYTITGTNKSFTFSIGGVNNESTLHEIVSIAALSNNIQFAVETNIYGDSVFSTFDGVENKWFQQPDLSFSAPNVYQLDLSSSVTNDFNITFGSNGQSIPSQYIIDKRPEENVIILDLRTYVGNAITYFDANGNAANYVNPDIAYPSAEKLYVSTGGSPLVFDICGSLQKDVGFSANTMYLFDQSHPSNENYPLVFGSTHDVFDSAFLKSSITTVGVPGYSGAYTLLDLSAGFQGPLYYFSTASVNMGFVPLQSQVDSTTKQFGDNVSFTILNNTGTDVSYNINGIYSYDISDAPLSGTLGYAQEHTLSYTITGVGKTMVFSVGSTTDISNSVIISDMSATTFAIQSNKYGTPVYAIYDNSDNIYYNQPSIKFGTSPKDIHLIDLSNSIVAPYVLTFGIQADGTSIDSKRILRKTLDNQIVLDLRGFSGEVMYYDENISGMGYVDPTTYTSAQTIQVTVSGDPLVLTMDNVLQKEISFSANQQYIFDQSHPSNINYPLVFATNPDVSYAQILKPSVITSVGELGKPGAYTLLDLSAGFQGPLYYFSDASVNMGFVPLSSTIDNVTSVSKEYGDTITFTILNNTGEILPYLISGTTKNVYSYDISGAPLTGSIGYGQEHQLSYTITCADKTLLFSVGLIVNTVEILVLPTTLFGVQNNIYGQPVYATYSDTKNTWYNQANLIFSSPTVYQIDLSYVDYNIDDYRLTFGTTIDDINSVLDTSKISRRPSENKIILDLRDISENVLYFDASNVGMGYTDPSVYTTATTFAVTLSGDPLVFAIDNVLQKAIDFSAGTYLFDQSDESNTGYQIVFGETHDSTKENYYNQGVTTVGIPGRDGAYTLLELTETKPLFYFSDGSANMGYVPVSVIVDDISKSYGEILEVTVFNNTGIDKPYTITGISSTDINDASTSGTISYKGETKLQYIITVANKSMTFTCDNVSQIIAIRNIPSVKFAVKNNLYGTPVFATYDEDDQAWYNQPVITFNNPTPNPIIQIDISDSSMDNYQLVLGTQLDISSTINETYVLRNPLDKKIFIDLITTDYSGVSFVYFEDTSADMGYVPPNPSPDQSYVVTIEGTPEVFALNGETQKAIDFSAGTYVFDQSHESNTQQLVFGRSYDVSYMDFYNENIGTITTIGTPGQEGAYTQLELPVGFQGPLFYFSNSSDNMGYVPVTIQVDSDTKNYGDSVQFTILNNTGIAQAYTIEGLLDSSDLSGAALSGSVPYKGESTLTYTITGTNKTMNFRIGNVVSSVVINDLSSTSVRVQSNMYNVPVFSIYDDAKSAWYNQLDISFSSPNVYQFDLSYTVATYELTFGTVADGPPIESKYILRKNAENKLILDLRTYNGSVIYYESTRPIMGYVKPDLTNKIAYNVTLSGDPIVYALENEKQKLVTFAPGSYIFHQSDITNQNDPIVFARTPDVSYAQILKDEVLLFGTMGEPGAYVQLDLSAGFTGSLYYYSLNSVNMGYSPLTIEVDNASKNYGDSVQFTISNNTGKPRPYTITGLLDATDLSDADLSGIVPYKGETTLNYNITGTNKTMVFHVQDSDVDVTRSVIIQDLTSIPFAIQPNSYGTDVFATYDSARDVWYNQPDLSFNAPNVYQFDLSSSIGNYKLVFGTTVDDFVNVVESPYVLRKIQENKIILDLRSYIAGNTLVYYEDSSANMSHMDYTISDISNVYYVSVSDNGDNKTYMYKFVRSTRQISFTGGEEYVFDQSDSTNAGEQIVFGRTPDASNNFLEGVTVIGTPGYPGAYTKLVLASDFSGDLFYYSNNTEQMGYALTLDVDSTSKQFGDDVTFTVINNTLYSRNYSIDGVNTYDISGSDMSGVIGFGEHTFTYKILTAGKTMSFNIGGASINVVISTVSSDKSFSFSAEKNLYDQSVFAVYDVSDQAWYNQPDLSFASGSVYDFDLSSSLVNGGYTMVFGTETDNSGTSVDSSRVIRLPSENRIFLDLVGYTGDPLVYFENSIAGMGYVNETSTSNAYDVSISSNPKVFLLSGTPQQSIVFSANSTYVFRQSDPTNAGQQLVFGTTYDDKANLYTADVRTVGTLGQPGTYTEITLASDFSGDLFYYSANTNNMGYEPLIITPDATTKTFNDQLSIEVRNNTGVDVSYNITGVDSFDLSGAELSGTVPYNGTSTYTYDIKTVNKTLTFTVDSISSDITINPADAQHSFAVQKNLYDQPVFAVYDVSDQAWYNQTDLSFVSGSVYDFDLSSSIVDGGYTLVFGSEVDSTNNRVPDSRIVRSANQIILDLNGYSESVVYFEDASAGMGYVNEISTPNAYDVSISSNPTMFLFSGTPQQSIVFTADNTYVFRQSDITNAGQQLVFGTTYDDETNLYTTGVRTVGTLGQPGAYTQITLASDFTGDIFYYSNTTDNMGYAPILITPDATTKSFNDQLSIDVRNNTGADVSYNITGVESVDLSGAVLSGTVPYGGTSTYTYDIKTFNKTLTFAVDGTSTDITINPSENQYSFAVQKNLYDQSVFAVYDVSDQVWYNQPDLSFASGNVYDFDLSSSLVNGGYTMVFGTETDNSGTSVDSSRVIRLPSENRIFLDLVGYTGDPLVYFENSIAGMGYVNETSTSNAYDVSISSNPKVFLLSGTPQQSIVFSANSTYVFRQSDSTNAGQQLVFGTEYDDKANLYTADVRTVGSPGQPGAYTQLELPSGFTGDLFYYSNASNNMGYASVSLSVDGTSKFVGDNVTFTISNNAGAVDTYTITGITSADISGEPLTGNVPYGGITTLSYTFTNSSDVNMTMTVGTESQTVLSTNAIAAYVRVQDSKYELSEDGGSTWITTPFVYLTYPNLYVFIVSDSTNTGYELTFGTTVDDTTSVDNSLITRQGTPGQPDANILLNLTSYNGEVSELHYFDNLYNNMGHVPGSNTILLRTTTYKVKVQNGVYALSVDGGTTWTEIPQIVFKPYDNLIFDQSDSTNSGEQIVFGTTFDDKVNLYTTGVTTTGTPGTSGANTQIILGANFSDDLYYYSAGSNDMGFEPSLYDNIYTMLSTTQTFNSKNDAYTTAVGSTITFDSNFRLYIRFKITQSVNSWENLVTLINDSNSPWGYGLATVGDDSNWSFITMFGVYTMTNEFSLTSLINKETELELIRTYGVSNQIFVNGVDYSHRYVNNPDNLTNTETGSFHTFGFSNSNDSNYFKGQIYECFIEYD